MNLVRMFDLKIIIQTRMKPGQGYYQLRFLRYKARTILGFNPWQDSWYLEKEKILNAPFIADLESIRLHKQKTIDKNNQIYNKISKLCTYIIRDKDLVRNKKANKYEDMYVGPYPITQVWINVNFNIRRGIVQELIIIIWIKPYHE